MLVVANRAQFGIGILHYPGVSVIKLITAVINGHMIVKYVSVL